MDTITLYTILEVMFALLLLFASLVSAGHPAWEADATTIAPDWITIAPTAEFQTWPNTMIRFCFEDEESAKRLEEYIRAAMQLWYAAGLPEGFKFKEVSKSACDRDPENHLLVSGSDNDGAFWTSIGHNFEGDDGRPVMVLNFQDNYMEKYKPAMIAHEIGHAWGMEHQHQDPMLWRWPRRGQPDLSLVIFNCQNVEGYNELVKEYESPMMLYAHDGPCRSSTAAHDKDFLAAEILPLETENYYTPHRMWPWDSDVDWKSIMIYESHSFGAKDEHGYAKSTLLRRMGRQVIEEPMVVTQDDVEGLMTLYNPKWGSLRVDLHNENNSPWFEIFKEKLKSCLRKH
ncbi:uncharacterized protein BDW43DRAFT_312260 [Aspergillus alliaceus]|uniref:uncharacterized protein n=1 Tax=Petromyces alliaceus TaxID=209559 RepID=UPI0012A47FDC|nr:uncharacterized protein BDW43DRAFT_312260 [Aspergillus alliaceus]KAB8232264.1 hypothetical protein BDW43DRAFT_312260 [Aspergillus alliaceus]